MTDLDADDNRRVVVESHGIEALMTLAKDRVEPDLVVATLWNVCIDDGLRDNQEGEESTMYTKDDGTNPAQERLGYFDHGRAIDVLCGLLDALTIPGRTARLADLIEMASLTGESLSATFSFNWPIEVPSIKTRMDFTHRIVRLT